MFFIVNGHLKRYTTFYIMANVDGCRWFSVVTSCILSAQFFIFDLTTKQSFRDNGFVLGFFSKSEPVGGGGVVCLLFLNGSGCLFGCLGHLMCFVFLLWMCFSCFYVFFFLGTCFWGCRGCVCVVYAGPCSLFVYC